MAQSNQTDSKFLHQLGAKLQLLILILWRHYIEIISKAINNFKNTLPAPQSELAKEILKDPYNLDFITVTEDYKEKELEN